MPLSKQVIKVLESLKPVTVHGFRATARTLLDEILKYRPDYIEHQLAHSVKDPWGILFLSNPRGNEEVWSEQRYGHYMLFEISNQFIEAAGYKVLYHYYRPAAKPIHEQPWLAIIAMKPIEAR